MGRFEFLDDVAIADCAVEIEGADVVDVMGGAIERGSTVLRADPKAVTFRQFALGAVNGRWRARVVIDVWGRMT